LAQGRTVLKRRTVGLQIAQVSSTLDPLELSAMGRSSSYRRYVGARLLLTVATTAIFAAATATESSDHAEEAVAVLPFGTVSGNVLQAAHEFLGIPFAPTPDRFDPPQPWTALYPGGRWEAKQHRAQCLQPAMPNLGIPKANFSEDCLYLNVYTPRVEPPSAHGEGWPTMLWIHGGGLLTGSANLPDYNGSVLASRQQVVVVAANYRLAAFGFAATGGPRGARANNGFRDQREAMRWVRAHIRAFGGDPHRLTIFGESAGGQSVAIHTVSPGSAGLFDRAISQSGDVSDGMPMEKALKRMAAFATNLGCAGAWDMACLRQVDAARFVQEDFFKQFMVFKPVIDGDLLPMSPLALIRSGSFNRVPFVLGLNGREGDGIIYPPLMATVPATAKDFMCALDAAFGPEKARKLAEVYPPDNMVGIDNRQVVSTFIGDILIGCATRELAIAWADANPALWMYVFQRKSTSRCTYIDQMGFFALPGAGHGVEIPYVFDNLQWLTSNPKSSIPTNTSCVLPAEDRALGHKMAELWAGFARTGHMEEGWPRFRAPHEASLQIDIGSPRVLDTETGFRRAQCDALKILGVGASSFLPVYESFLKCQRTHAQEGSRATVQSKVLLVQQQVHPGFDSSVALCGLFLCGFFLITASMLQRRRVQELQHEDGTVKLLSAVGPA